MSEWKEYKLGELANVQTGPFGSQLHASDYIPIGIPSIMPTNIGARLNLNTENVAYISEHDANRLTKYRVRQGDIVYSRRGDVEKCAFITKNEDGWLCGTGCLIVRINSELLNPKFCAYYLSTDEIKAWISSNAVGTTMPNLNTSILQRLPLLLPPYNQQTAIAAILSSLDDKIDLLHRQNATLEKMAETLFRQWFVEEAKEEWEYVKIGDFVSTNVLTITKKYPFEIVEYLDTSSLTEGMIGELQILNLVDAPSRAKRLVKHNDILLSTVRPDQKHYGIVKNPKKNLVVSTGFCVITCHTISPHFTYLLLTSSEMTEFLHSIAEGSTSTYPSLKPSDIEKVEFLLPPENKMNEFEKIVSNYWDKINSNQTQIRTLTAMRDTLLPKLMSGELRVSEL